MNENMQKREIAFPVAAIFYTLSVLIWIIRIKNSYLRDRVVPNFLTVLGIISSVLLVIVLFRRKRGLILWIPLGTFLALDLISAFDFIVSGFTPSVIPTVKSLLFLLFAVFQDRKEESGAASIFRKIWFIPGIVSTIDTIFYFYNSYRIYSEIDEKTMYNSLMVSIPFAFLLGWWLTHPFKKERSVCQMPATQLYGQQNYQDAGVSGTARKVFCSGCGRELSPEENFCSVCGKQRTTPAQGAQPVFQQQANPQMRYAQDAPSGGIMALSFFFPIVGLILYLVWKNQTPLKAHSAGKGALIGVIVPIAGSVILAILAM